jgi:lipopolysaccharide biosynthesis regulator YciM
MPNDATFLLAALFVGFGAVAFAFKVYSDRDRELPPRISADYIRGLNLVLSRKTDEALELFVQMAKVDDDTLETHFALGHLFRRRGEIERAIRVHQNLLARPNLNDTQRHQAVFSLAEDYLGAGLFDRAEQLFHDLTDSPTLAEAALDKLVHIYEREREWQKAIDAQRKLEMLRGAKTSHVAHYYCELADQARAAGNRDLAREYLRNTVRSESGQLRGTLIRAALAQEERDFTQAIGLYEQTIEKDRNFVTEVLPPLIECYRNIDKLAYFEAKLQRWIEQDPTLRRELAFTAIICNLTSSPVLASCIESFVLGNPVLAGLVNAEELKSLAPEKRQQAIERITIALRQIAASSPRYRCSNCGYSTQRFIWHCPSCKLWETIRPVQTLPLETVLG